MVNTRSKKPFDNADFLGVVPVPAPPKNILPVSVPTKKTSSTEASENSFAPIGQTDAVVGSTNDVTNSTNDDAAATKAKRYSSVDADDKKSIDNNDAKNSASADVSPINFDSLCCSFVFEPNISSSGLDDQLNGSYNLCFGPDIFFNHDYTLFESSSKVLRQHINWIFDR